MTKLRLFFTIAFVSIISYVNAQYAILKGTVVEKATNETLLGTNVYLLGTNIGTATNAQGEYSIKRIKPGTYTLIVSFSGLRRIKQSIELKAGDNTMNFALEPSVKHLGEVVVTGTGTAHHLKDAPIATELIKAKRITASGANSFTNLMLNTSPSFDFSPGAMGSFMTLNGLSNDFILILIDGKRIYGDIGGNNDLNRINLDNIERVEVVKGASSLLYGSDAIAGVVNIITKKTRQTVNITNTSRISNYLTYDQNNTVKLNLGKFSSVSTFTHKRSNGWQLSPYEIKINKKTKKETLVETDAMNQNAYNINNFKQFLEYRLTDKLSVYANGSYYQKDLLIPTSVRKYGYFYQDVSYGGGAKYLLKNRDYISFDFNGDNYKYHYKYNQNYKDYANGDKLLRNDQYMQNFSLKSVHTLSRAHKLSVGADLLNERIESDRILNGKADVYTAAAYAQDEWQITKGLDIVAGLRFVKHKEFGTKLTPKISALYKFKHLNIRGTYGFGFKAPTLKEMYFDWHIGSRVYMGNADLKPQESEFMSAGVEYHGSLGSVSVTAYRNNVNNLIDYKKIALLPNDATDGVKTRKQHANIAETRSQGVDFIFNTRLAYGFTLGGGYSYVDAIDLETEMRLERVAQNYANIHLDYNHRWSKYNFGANISGRYQDGKFYEEGSTEAYNIWTLTTIHDFYHFQDFKFRISAGIDNIFDYSDDSPYGARHSIISPGRTYFVSLSINFAK